MFCIILGLVICNQKCKEKQLCLLFMASCLRISISSSRIIFCSWFCSWIVVKNLLCFYSVNVSIGELEDRNMMTGMHTVADIFCVGCGSILGWTYVRLITTHSFFFLLFLCCINSPFGFFQETAHEKSQKYKEGKSVLERLVEVMCEKTFLI